MPRDPIKHRPELTPEEKIAKQDKNDRWKDSLRDIILCSELEDFSRKDNKELEHRISVGGYGSIPVDASRLLLELTRSTLIQCSIAKTLWRIEGYLRLRDEKVKE